MALETCPTQELIKNELLAKQVLYKRLEFYHTYKPKNTTNVYTLKQKE